MSNIVDFPEPHGYILDSDEKISGVRFEKSLKDSLDIHSDGTIVMRNKSGIIKMTKNDLSELMVMWLALNDPDVIKFDDDQSP